MNQSSPGTTAPVIKSFAGSTKDSRCLEVWFADNVTDDARAWLLEAINEKALRGVAQNVPSPEPFAWVVLSDETGNTRLWTRNGDIAKTFAAKHLLECIELYRSPVTSTDRTAKNEREMAGGTRCDGLCKDGSQCNC